MTPARPYPRDAGRPVHPLADRSLSGLRGRLRVPTYDRSALAPSVVHVGVGGFHRAHQLVYFDDLAEGRYSADWGVVGVGLHHRAMRDALAPQDHLYTVVERGAGEQQARVVGALVGCHFAPDSPRRVLDALSDPRTRLVTLTVTGTAYRLDPDTGDLDPDPDADGPPRTVFGYLVEALARRRHAGLPPFTVLSCDNLSHNGGSTRAAVLAVARGRAPALTGWIADAVAFPNSMVDRIVPATPPELRGAVARAYGVDDRWPVATEPFSDWVVEDDFRAGRPPLDLVGVRFVPDVTRHHLVKTRLLNAGHSALGYLGTLAGHRRTDEVLADPVLAGYLSGLLEEEIGPLLPVPDGVELPGYVRTLLARLANPAVGDRLDRLCGRGSTKMPSYLLPSLTEALDRGRPAELLTLAVAAWLRYLRGVDPTGQPIDVEDPLRDTLVPLARTGGSDPRPLLAVRAVFADLGDRPAFVADLEEALVRLDRHGVRATIAAYRGAGLPVPA
jgi:mannitol-1-phosphate/altronate dehydrogenase